MPERRITFIFHVETTPNVQKMVVHVQTDIVTSLVEIHVQPTTIVILDNIVESEVSVLFVSAQDSARHRPRSTLVVMPAARYV